MSTITSLKLADDLFPALLAGKKKATVRAGARLIVPGPLTFDATSGDPELQVTVYVTETKIIKLKNLTYDDAWLDGETTPRELAAALKRFYPDITPESIVTVVRHTVPM